MIKIDFAKNEAEWFQIQAFSVNCEPPHSNLELKKWKSFRRNLRKLAKQLKKSGIILEFVAMNENL